MSHDDGRAPLASSRGKMSRTVQRLFDRGRAEIDRATKLGRIQLERRQVTAELDKFWIRLGKTAYRLVEAGEVDHPGIRRVMVHVTELEEQLARLKKLEAELGPPPAGGDRESSR